MHLWLIFLFKQKTAYEMRIIDWSSTCALPISDGSDALAERADDEIDVAQHALRLGDAAAMLADEAHRMRLVHQYHPAGFLRHADHFLQRRDLSEHRINAPHPDDLPPFGRQRSAERRIGKEGVTTVTSRCVT